MLLVVVRSKRALRASVLQKRKKKEKKNESMLVENCFTSTETLGTWNESQNDVYKHTHKPSTIAGFRTPDFTPSDSVNIHSVNFLTLLHNAFNTCGSKLKLLSSSHINEGSGEGNAELALQNKLVATLVLMQGAKSVNVSLSLSYTLYRRTSKRSRVVVHSCRSCCS